MTMSVHERACARNTAPYSRRRAINRIYRVATIGFQRRRRWLQPFSVDVYRLSRILVGGPR